MANQIRALATKPEDWNATHGFHTLEGERTCTYKLVSELKHAMAHTDKYTNKLTISK